MSTSSDIIKTPPTPKPTELLVTSDSRGNIFVDGSRDNTWARNLSILKLLLGELFFQHGIVASRKKAIDTVLGAKIDTFHSDLTIEVHPELKEKFPKQTIWKIHIELPFMIRFINEKMPK